MVLRRGRHRPPGPLPSAGTSHDPGSPKWTHVKHTAPTSTDKGGTRDGEGEKRAAGQQLACPHDCLSLLVLIPPWGHQPWWCPGTLSPAFSSLGGAGSCSAGAAAAPAPQDGICILWQRHIPSTRLPLGKGCRTVPQLPLPGKAMGTSPIARSLPSPLELFTPCLALQMDLGVLQDAAPTKLGPPRPLPRVTC